MIPIGISFLVKKVPDYIGNDLQAEEIYKQYISKILDQFKDSYDKIAISLPSILLTEEKYLGGSMFREKREMMQSDDVFAHSANDSLSPSHKNS